MGYGKGVAVSNSSPCNVIEVKIELKITCH